MGGNSSGSRNTRPNARNGIPGGSRISSVPSATSSQAQNGNDAGSHAGCQPASHCSASKRIANNPPATHSTGSPTPGNHNKDVPNNDSGTITALTSGTAKRLAIGPLRLTGKPSASRIGNRPRAMLHCARPNARHQLQLRSRPRNTRARSATARKDNQKPDCSPTSGSNSRTASRAISSGSQTPKCRYRKRHRSTRATITSARWTGTSKPASQPYASAPTKARLQAQGNQATRRGQIPQRANNATRP